MQRTHKYERMQDCELLLMLFTASPQMAPINAEDMHASGDLDAGRGLRVDTARAPSRGLVEALVDPDVPLSPESDHPKDPFAVRFARSILR